jgi:hypothetical protein
MWGSDGMENPKVSCCVMDKSIVEECSILYGFNQFVGHGSRRVPDVPKFGPCHGSRRGPDERSERDT